jgi:flavin reductase (DIM6/NTAB) family NADH-FMN oxidoreductase RutF
MALMIVNPAELKSRDVYRLLVATVVPRPIAWVATQSRTGVVNVAPFSYFQAVRSRPALVSICIGQRTSHGQYVDKDSLRNIKDTGELVINIAGEASLDKLNQTAAEYPPEISEAEAVGLAMVAGELVAPPRIAECPVQMECTLDRIIVLGETPVTSMVIAKVVRVHIADSVWDPDAGAVDPRKLRPLARLGGTHYATLGEIMSRPRPE